MQIKIPSCGLQLLQQDGMAVGLVYRANAQAHAALAFALPAENIITDQFSLTEEKLACFAASGTLQNFGVVQAQRTQQINPDSLAKTGVSFDFDGTQFITKDSNAANSISVKNTSENPLTILGLAIKFKESATSSSTNFNSIVARSVGPGSALIFTKRPSSLYVFTIGKNVEIGTIFPIDFFENLSSFNINKFENSFIVSSPLSVPSLASNICIKFDTQCRRFVMGC